MLAAGTAFEAIRAGAGTFRALIDLPARGRIGPIAFAEFSRATDLSPRGVAFYIVYGVGGMLLTGAIWIIAIRIHATPFVRRFAFVSVVCSLLILALTTQAAPLMWRVGSSPNDGSLLADLLDRFTLWTDLRVACADVSFLALLAALAGLSWPRAEVSPR